MPLDHPAPPAREPSLTRYLSPMCSKCSAGTPCLMVTSGTDRSRDVLATGPGEWYRADEVAAALRREREENETLRSDRRFHYCHDGRPRPYPMLICSMHRAAPKPDGSDCFNACAEIERLVADRDRYRAALENIAGGGPGGCSHRKPCGCNGSPEAKARLALAPPTPAAQESKGDTNV